MDTNVNVVKQNSLVLSNAAVLASSILIMVGDNDCAMSLNGVSLTRDRIEQIVAARITSNILNS